MEKDTNGDTSKEEKERRDELINIMTPTCCNNMDEKKKEKSWIEDTLKTVEEREYNLTKVGDRDWGQRSVEEDSAIEAKALNAIDRPPNSFTDETTPGPRKRGYMT